MAAYFLGFLLVWMTRGKYRANGFAFMTYLLAYGVARFAVEFFRAEPPIFAWGIPAAQVAQVFSVAIAISLVCEFFLLNKAARTA